MVRCLRKKHLLLLLAGLFICISLSSFVDMRSQSVRNLKLKETNINQQELKTNDDTSGEDSIDGDTSGEDSVDDAGDKMCSLSQRVNKLEERCKKFNLSYSYTPSKTQIPHTLVDDKHKLIFCIPAKCGSSAWLNLLLHSRGEENPKPRMMVHSVGVQLKHGLRKLRLYTDEEITERLKTYYKFIVVRHPFERLVSAWRDKFIMPNGPYQGKGKAIAAKYKQDRGELKNITVGDPYWETRAYFVEFARKQAEHKGGGADVHWARYQAFCNPCAIKWDAVIKVETTDRDANFIISRLGNDSAVKVLPINHSHQEKSVLHHLQKYLPEFADIRTSVLDYLYRFYGQDMNLFGYIWNQKTLTAGCDGGCC